MGADRDAGSLYRELAPAVLGYLRGQRVPEPEDVLGEVFLQVARDLGRGRFRPDGRADAERRWVFTIARNRALDAHRRSSRDRSSPVAAVPETDDAAADTTPDGPDPVLVAAMARLSPDQRETLGLRFVADLAIDDVAEITGRTAGAVKALQHRGLENLRKLLSSPYPDGTDER